MLVLLALSLSHAADLFVGPGLTHPTLSGAIAVASPGDRLLLAPGSYDADLEITKDLTLQGLRGAAVTTLTRGPGFFGGIQTENADLVFVGLTLDGGGLGRVAQSTGSGDLTFRHSIVRNGYDFDGGCLDLEGADLRLEHSLVESCVADEDGGAIRATGGSISLESSIFFDNESADGGAIYADDAVVNVERSLFERNRAERGGAVFTTDDPLHVRRSVACDNFGDTSGGFAHGIRAAITLDNSVIWHNAAANEGGGVGFSNNYAEAISGTHNLWGWNQAPEGGSVYAHTGEYYGLNEMFVHHTGPAVARASSAGSLSHDHSLSWGNTALGGDELDTVVGDPLLANGVPDACSVDGWLMPTGSAATDAASDVDLDTSVGDIGPFGGLTPLADLDQDGYFPPWDCDDNDATVSPDAPELCDGVDNDCDFEIDEGLTLTEFFVDGDGDGTGDGTGVMLCDGTPLGLVPGGDCDDADPNVSPAVEETCDGTDEDCDGVIDNGFTLATFYRDRDGDDFGSPLMTVEACVAPPGYTELPGDCDDLTNAVYTGAPERCDQVDNDCDGDIDEEAVDPETLWGDLDGDGYGAGAAVSQCPSPGLVDNDDDCDDTNTQRHPGRSEVCDGVDNDCDLDIDEDPTDGAPYFTDDDFDGFGGAAAGRACTLPVGFLATSTDCDDTLAYVNPDADEFCDGVDTNCNGQLDDDAVDAELLYEDRDGDGHGNPIASNERCYEAGWSRSGDDCNDSDPTVRPSATEIPGNAVDEDCDGEAQPDVTPVPTDDGPTPIPTDDEDDSDGSCSSSPVPTGLFALVFGLLSVRRSR